MRTIGIGIIGMGWMGSVHSRAYRAVPDRFPDCQISPRLIICADEVEARAKEAQARFGFSESTTDWQQVLDHPDVDVVNIATPNHMHLEQVKAAAEAGKHILCEKPVGLDPEETAEIAQIVQEAGLLSFVGYNYRWAPAVQRALELVQQGKIGRLTHYKGWLLVGYASDPGSVLSWRLQSDLGGMGALGDLMSHAIDMGMMLAGPIKRVIGQSETFIKERPVATPGQGDHYSTNRDGPTEPVTNEDYVSALVQFENGVRGALETCRVIQGPQSEIGFSIHGTEGAIRWDFERMNEFELYLTDDEQDKGYRRVLAGPEHPLHASFSPGAGIGLGYDDLKTIEAYHFMESIASGRQGEPGFAQAQSVAEVQDAIKRSWVSEHWENIQKIGPH
ncbi:MAG: Gfo/Idh/MocA family oxidoreductase [Candidatus Latescibacteria bacterium]|jgi:predicted dehydrogenase|nr:Gfo/Idh/MocA family oxidoreductase [Candidatus Latescibacterota bacterium]